MLVTVLSVTKEEKTCEKLIEIHTTLLLIKSLVCFVPFYLVQVGNIETKKNNRGPGRSRETCSSLRLLHLLTLRENNVCEGFDVIM